MAINIFEDYLSNNSGPLKVNDLYRYQDVATQTIAKFNKVIKDLKDIDPKKAAYYAQLAISPNPVKVRRNTHKSPFENSSDEFGETVVLKKEYDPPRINVLNPDSGFRTYTKILNEIANYKNSIPSIEELPFKGRATLESYTLDDSSLWDIKLQKYKLSSPKIPENPLKIMEGGTPWFPVTNVSLSYNTVKNQTFELPNDLKLIIPRYKSEVPSISITCFDNQDSLIRRYFMDYMNAIYDDNRRTLPYKEASSELTLYIYTQDKKIKFKKIFYVIPEYEFKIDASTNPKITEFKINFNVIGEFNDDTKYIPTAPINPAGI